MNPWEKGIWCLTTGLTAAVLVKLWSSGLLKLYKLFFAYLAVDFLSSIGGMAIPFHSSTYAYFYVAAQTVKIAIAAFMLVEIYSLALEQHPALAQFGRSVIRYILLAAAAIPFIGVFLDQSSSNPHPYLRAFFTFERTMDSTMAIFLIFISVFMAWFPVRLRGNVIVYIGGFIVWSLSRSAYIDVINHWINDKNVKLATNIAQMCIALGCLVFWLVGFKRQGEARTAVVGHLWNRAEADRLTGQLETINDGLAKLRKR